MSRGYAYIQKLALFLLLLIFWVILVSSLALHELVMGAMTAALVASLTVWLLGRALDPHLRPAVILRLPLFLLRLSVEIVKANLDVARIILHPRLPVEPGIVEYRTFLQGDLPRTVFADSITLTPGTVTVWLEDDLLLVHCLCPYHREGLPQLEKMVAWLFGQKREGGGDG
ncbi:MAG: Na+/H+ antiporter subunit E [Candidatus Geothermincolales bacterium]